MEKQRWCLFGWSVYPKDGIRLLLCGWLAFGWFGWFGSWGAYAAPPSSSLHRQILLARKVALQIRGYEQRILLIQDEIPRRQGRISGYEKQKAKEKSAEMLERLDRWIAQEKASTQRDSQSLFQLQKYVAYLRSREISFQGQRWRGHLFYHPERGLLKEKTEGARWIVSLKDWRAHCATKPPYSGELPQVVSSERLPLGKRMWRVLKVRFPYWSAADELDANGRYIVLGSRAWFLLCRQRDYVVWDRKKNQVQTLPRFNLDDFYSRHPEMLPWLKGLLGGSFSMLSLDSEARQAHLLFSVPRYTLETKRPRVFLVRWDLSKNRLEKPMPLPEELSCTDHNVFDLHTQTLYSLKREGLPLGTCSIYEADRAEKVWRTSLTAYNLKEKKFQIVSSIVHEQLFSSLRFERERRSLVAIERHRARRESYAFVFDLRQGRRFAFRVKQLVYGLAFLGGVSLSEKRMRSNVPYHKALPFQRKQRQLRKTTPSLAQQRFTGLRQQKRDKQRARFLTQPCSSRGGKEVYWIDREGIEALSSKGLKRRWYVPIRKLLSSKTDPEEIMGFVVRDGNLFVRARAFLLLLSPEAK